MPELPEVETVRRGLEPFLTGKIIESVTLRRKDLRAPITPGFAKALAARKILSTTRRGKYIVVALDSGQGFVLHLGMSGRIRIARKGQYKPLKHDHIILRMKDGTHIAFNDARRFGMAFLVSSENWKNGKPFSDMGPEPLEKEFTGKALHGALKNKKISIKTALLDQRIVAGVGNIYACEALFMAGIDPLTLACQITSRQAGKLVQVIRIVLERAIEAGGSTLRDYKNTNGEEGYFQHEFSVYDREGQGCKGCSCKPLKTGGVKRIVQAGRSTFYCPVRQK